MGASGCKANPGACTSNLQSIKDRHGDQPAKKSATPYGIYLLPLLGTTHFQKCMYMQFVLWNVMECTA
jgi:hypothetical protein